MKLLFVNLLLAVIVNNLCSACADENNLELELLQVLFRHGDRTPDRKEVYENDPYDSIYQQIGYGQLTKLGKQRQYKVGQVLRERYDDFLGEFSIDDVYARSTNLDRTKMSLQLVLAGLYPPSRKTVWNRDIFWTPIPTHHERQEIDFLSFIKCSKFGRMYKEQLDIVDEKSNSDEDFVNHIRAKIHANVKSNFMLRLYMNLRIATLLSLPLPNWCSKSDYKKIKTIAEAYFSSLTRTNSMSKIAAGTTIEQLLKNIRDHENNLGAKKVYLYSVHDLNVAAFTNVHNFTGIPKIPDFGSSVVIEQLRGPDNQTYLRMFLWTGVSERWIPLKLENCDYACPLSEYEELINSILPDEEAKQCGTLNAYCEKHTCNK